MARKRYKVRLTDEKRNQLSQIIARGKAAAKKLSHASIPLKAEESPQWGPAWTDEQIAEAFNMVLSSVHRGGRRMGSHSQYQILTSQLTVYGARCQGKAEKNPQRNTKLTMY